MVPTWTPWALLAASWFVLGASWGLLAAKTSEEVPKRCPRGSKRHPRDHFGAHCLTEVETQSLPKCAFRLHHGPKRVPGAPKGHGRRNLLTLSILYRYFIAHRSESGLKMALFLGVCAKLVLHTNFGTNFGAVFGSFWRRSQARRNGRSVQIGKYLHCQTTQ